MSDQHGSESFDDDLGSYSVDEENQLQPEDTLDGGGDPLDEGYSPPDIQDRRTEWGTTAYEQSQEETIEQRIMQEEPDPNSAAGAPDDEGGLDRENRDDDRLGGDDEDSIPASDDFLGDEGVDAPAGRLVAPDQGAHEDVDSGMEADEYADTGGESAEEAAMRIVEGE